MTEEPARLLVATWKTSIKSYPVGVRSALFKPSRLVKEKEKAMQMAKPRTPLRAIVAIMHHGTMVDAFWTSSAMWQGPS